MDKTPNVTVLLSASSGWVSKDVTGDKSSADGFVSISELYASANTVSQQDAHQALVRLGIVTDGGKLTKRYS